MRQSTAISLLLAAAASSARDLSPRDTDCKDVHIFLAKGNNEPYPGRQGKLVTAICEGLSSCDYEDIKFYNPLESVYCDSVFEGAANGISQITAYNEACPSSKLVVSGYSQGGHVVGDVLGGGGGTFFQGCVQASNEGLDADSAPGNMIVAAAIFGDTRHTANQPYNVFSGAGDNGLFPRTEAMLAKLVTYGDALHNYCVETDPICAGGDVVADHLNYFDLYSDTVAEWVHERIAAFGNSTSTTSSASDSASATSTKTTKTKSETATEEATTTTETSSETGSETETTTETGSESESETESAPATKTKTTAETTTEASTTTPDSSSPTTAATTASPASASASASGSSASDSTSAAEATASDSAGSRNSQLGAVMFALGAVLVL